MSKEKWTKEKIIDGIEEVVRETGIQRMPSSSEVISYFGDSKLSNAISHRRLWRQLAEELNLDIKESETAFGKSFEAKAMEILVVLGYEVEKMVQNHPYDLLIDGSIKADVKVSKLYRGPNGNFYTFNLEKQYGTCDIYILFLVDDKKTIQDTLIVPSKYVIRNTQISVGETKSKYYRFKSKWDYIERMIHFQNELLEGDTI